ncbi:MAG: hypothetical protein OXI96_02990, partial [Acidimicrobiaceae bacterium]|nr:hypothetical protein [Acidimicrobiaceae bacterium]
ARAIPSLPPPRPPGGAPDASHRTHQPSCVRNPRLEQSQRPLRSGHEPASTTHLPTLNPEKVKTIRYEVHNLKRTALLVSGTSNMTFQALAADTLPDLAFIKGSRQTRVLPRLKK